jgi:hypothetical protein
MFHNRLSSSAKAEDLLHPIMLFDDISQNRRWEIPRRSLPYAKALGRGMTDKGTFEIASNKD